MKIEKKRRVVITGLGTVNPTGNTVAESWAAVKAGRCAVGPITAFDTTDFKVKLAAEVKDFDPAERIDRREARKMARFTQFAVAAADEAIHDSGIALENIDHTRFGVILSSGIGGLPTIEEEHTRGQQRGFEKVSPYFVPMSIGNMAAGQVAIRFGLQGMCSCPTTACAGGTNAIGDAFHRIRDGYEDRMLCGGSESCISPLGVGGFASMKALCTADDPARASIPFDARRSGFVMGEGAGVIVLEEYEHAAARGAHIYGEVCGYGNTNDAYHMTAPDPDALGSSRAIQMAVEEAGIRDTDEIYINAHGTSTPINDKTETKAIKLALGETVARKAHISSTKSMTGHMLGAAGGVEAIATVLALKNGVIPPTIGYAERDPECDLDYTPNRAVQAAVTLGLSTSLGFGGHNGCLAFRKFEP